MNNNFNKITHIQQLIKHINIIYNKNYNIKMLPIINTLQ